MSSTMTRNFLVVVAMLMSLTCLEALRLPTSPMLRNLNGVKVALPESMAVMTAAATPLLLTPSAAVADGGAAAVGIPLAISVLVMIPFLYYQQALRPKARTVQQIPLDENLREIKPSPFDKKKKK